MHSLDKYRCFWSKFVHEIWVCPLAAVAPPASFWSPGVPWPPSRVTQHVIVRRSHESQSKRHPSRHEITEPTCRIIAKLATDPTVPRQLITKELSWNPSRLQIRARVGKLSLRSTFSGCGFCPHDIQKKRTVIVGCLKFSKKSFVLTAVTTFTKVSYKTSCWMLNYHF